MKTQFPTKTTFPCLLIFFFILTSLQIFCQEEKSILILSSNPQILLTNENLVDGLTRGLEDPKQVGFVEIKTTIKVVMPPLNDSEGSFTLPSELLREFDSLNFDLIICLDRFSLDYYVRNRETFHGAPVIFNTQSPLLIEKYNQQEGMLGIQEMPNYIKTLSLALSHRPETRNILAVYDSDKEGRLYYEELKRNLQLAGFPQELIPLGGLSEREMSEALDKFSPEDTLIFLLSFRVMPDGKFLPKERGNQFFFTSNLPTYTAHRETLDRNILGGCIVSGSIQGEIIGSAARAYLEGKALDEINLIKKDTLLYVFDQAQLTRFGLTERDIPHNSRIVNGQISLYHKYKYLFWGVSLLVLILIGLVVTLILINHKIKRTQARLESSEQLIILAQSVGMVASWEYNFTKKTFWASEEVFKAYGLESKKDFQFKDLFHVIHPDDRVTFLRKIVLSVRHKSEYTVSFRTIGGNNFRGTYIMRGSTLVDRHSGECKMIAAVLDVTHMKEIEAALDNERSLFSSLINTIPDPVGYKDREAVYRGCNKAFSDALGLSEEEIIGKTDSDLFSVELAEQLKEKDELLFTKGEDIHFENWFSYPDGRKVLFNTLKTPYIDSDGDFLGLIGVSRDITEFRRIENDLVKEQKLLATTLSSIGEGVISINLKGEIIFINDKSCELADIICSEVIGKIYSDVFSFDQTEGHNVVEQILLGVEREAQSQYMTLHSWSGHKIDILRTCSPIYDKEKLVGAVIIFLDVSSELATEKELQKVNKLESIGLLAGGIAHDFNNILASILGNLELAKENNVNEIEETRELLSDAVKATLRARGLTQQLLTFAKGGSPIKEIASLPQVIEDSANFILHGSGIDISFSYLDDLWPANVDIGQFGQVIQNIVLNSKQVMPEGGHIAVECSNIRESYKIPLLKDAKCDFICIKIMDSGPGITPDVLDRIFDPYFTTKESGSGLGLSISHSIIMKHGGKLLVSSLDEGTHFLIYLPASHAQVSARPLPISTKLTQGNLSILVMDDEEPIQKIIHKLLVSMGHRVHITTRGEEAVDAYLRAQEAEKTYDLVIMDLIVKGGMGGKEATQAILSVDQSAKIIVTSGYSQDQILSKYKNYGFKAYLAKPFQKKDLDKAIRDAIV